jgi:DNA-binding PadR family transcriptional regulator
MGTIEDVRFRILSFLMEAKKANAKQLEKVAKCANKTFLKVRQQLEKEGLIMKRYENKPGGGLYAIYTLTDKGIEEAKKEALRRDLNKRINEASPETLEQMVAKLEKELEYYKIKEKIEEYENAPLPLTAVIKKLLMLGFKIEDFNGGPLQYGIIPYGKGEREEIEVSSPKLHNYFMGRGGPFGKGDDEFSPDEIEIKLIPASEVREAAITNLSAEKEEWEENEQNILLPTEVWEKYGAGWVILSNEPINGYYIIGAYRELLDLYNILFEYEWLKWKEEFNLSDEDWKIVGPFVFLDMVSESGRIDLPIIIGNHLDKYVLSKKPDGFEKLKEIYKCNYREEPERAEEMAKKTIEYFNKLRKTPIDEIWNEVENKFRYFDEGSRRTFEYLKSKYAVQTERKT